MQPPAVILYYPYIESKLYPCNSKYKVTNNQDIPMGSYVPNFYLVLMSYHGVNWIYLNFLKKIAELILYILYYFSRITIELSRAFFFYNRIINMKMSICDQKNKIKKSNQQGNTLNRIWWHIPCRVCEITSMIRTTVKNRSWWTQVVTLGEMNKGLLILSGILSGCFFS